VGLNPPLQTSLCPFRTHSAAPVAPAGRLPFTYPSHTSLVGLGLPYYRRPTQLVLNETVKPGKLPSLDPTDWIAPPAQWRFGHGLSYSTFTYSDISVTPALVTVRTQPWGLAQPSHCLALIAAPSRRRA
jgi:hypothetical protein